MKQLLTLAVIGLLLSGCDCIQKASGVVLDSETKEPLENVALGKYAKEDTTNSFSRRSYSNKDGHFEYSSVGGGLGSCAFDLFFSKKGYETKKAKFEQPRESDTIYLKPMNNHKK